MPIFAQLAPLGGTELAEVLERMWKCNIDNLENHLGPRHLSLYDQLISSSSERWLGSRLDASRDVIFSTLTAFAQDVEAAASSSSSSSSSDVGDDGPGEDSSSHAADPHPGASTPEIYKLLLKLVQTRPPAEGNAEQFAEQLLVSSSPSAVPSPSLPSVASSALATSYSYSYSYSSTIPPTSQYSYPDPTGMIPPPSEPDFPTRAKTAAYARKLLARACARRRDWPGCLAHMRAVVALRAAVYGEHNPRVVLEMLSLEEALRRGATAAAAAGVGVGVGGGEAERLEEQWLAEAAEVRRRALVGAGGWVAGV